VTSAFNFQFKIRHLQNFLSNYKYSALFVKKVFIQKSSLHTVPGLPRNPTILMMAAETQTKLQTKETFHFINDPADAINEAAIGLTEYNANLSYSPTHKIVYRSDLDAFRKDHVTTIGFAGGGQYVSLASQMR
jgi:hypothetical protein